MNECCKKEFQKFQDELARTSETLIKFSGEQKSLMEIAAARRAEILVDVMAQLKEFVNKK
jgi:hypothetical protein